MIITIDGPAGTGKSTVASMLAQRLGLECLDTGAMYRGAALMAIELEIDPSDGDALAHAVREADLNFDWSQSPPRLRFHDRDVSRRIRDLDVSEVVSIVAAQPPLRRVLVNQQRSIASRHRRLVSEGRDQGSVVFPDAPVRFFFVADDEVRAERRVAQLAEAGKPVDRGRVLSDIRQRDSLDSSRAEAPLVCPQGALVIDTSHRSATEVVDELERIVRNRLGSELTT